jgi:surfactin synthase thioesterase subunit
MRPHDKQRAVTGHEGRCKVFCFPHAGGSADAFRDWPARGSAQAEFIAVEYPGRGHRFGESALTRFEPLLALLMADLSPALHGPFAFYGQSMGALVAFELTRALRRQGRAQPLSLFVASRRAPDLPTTLTGLGEESDEQLMHRLLEAETALPAAFRLPAWKRHFLDVLRADLRATEAYDFHAEPPISVPMVGIWAERDPWVTRAQVAAWHHHTDAGFRLVPLGGNHVLQSEDAQQALCNVITAQLSLRQGPRAEALHHE